MRGSSTTGSAAAASNDSAATDSHASSRRRVSMTSSAACATLTALLLMNARPSRGPSRAGESPASLNATRASTSSSPRHTWPSPTSASAMSASLVRSPVPSEPSWRVNGVSPALSALDQRIEQFASHAGPAGAELVCPRRHRGAHQLGRQRTAGAAGVAAQEAQRVALAGVGRHAITPQRADPSGHAVELSPLGPGAPRSRSAPGRCGRLPPASAGPARHHGPPLPPPPGTGCRRRAGRRRRSRSRAQLHGGDCRAPPGCDPALASRVNRTRRRSVR